MDEHYAQGRQASADNTDIDFDITPSNDFGLVPGGVCRDSEVDERLEAEDGYDGDEGTDTEHHSDAGLFAPRQFKAKNFGQRQA